MSDTAEIVDIPEYLDCELAAGERLAREPAFWLVHLLVTMGDPSTDVEEYGVTPSAYEAMRSSRGPCSACHSAAGTRPWPCTPTSRTRTPSSSPYAIRHGAASVTWGNAAPSRPATPEDAWTVVARALSHCGTPEDVAPRLARELLGADGRDGHVEPSWTVTGDSPVPVCSSRYSPRQVPIALGITPNQAQALVAALRGDQSADL